jgi:hypothetical protein
MLLDRIDGEADDLDATLVELGFDPSSVVHTGVKSFGCEKSTAQELPIQSWKRILPSVVCASKSGAVSLIARVITYLRYMRERDGLGIAQQSDYTAV